jgi:hypothetical protein
MPRGLTAGEYTETDRECRGMKLRRPERKQILFTAINLPGGVAGRRLRNIIGSIPAAALEDQQAGCAKQNQKTSRDVCSVTISHAHFLP